MKSIADIIHQKTFPLRILDDQGNHRYREYITGDWWTCELDDKGNTIYYESSNGVIEDNR